MRIKTFIIISVCAFSFPVLCAAQQAAAKPACQKQQHQNNKPAGSGISQSNTAYLRNCLSKNRILTEAQKTELINLFESQYDKKVSLRGQRYADSVNFFIQTANSPDMSQDQKKSTIKLYFEANKAPKKPNAEQQRMERIEEMNRIRSSDIKDAIQQTRTER